VRSQQPIVDLEEQLGLLADRDLEFGYRATIYKLKQQLELEREESAAIIERCRQETELACFRASEKATVNAKHKYESSVYWRIGRFAMLPILLVKRVLR